MNTITITINEHFVRTEMEFEENGKRPAGYMAYNAHGKGKPVATVSGPIEIVKGHVNVDMGRIPSGTYALRDILAFARRGEHGLSIVE